MVWRYPENNAQCFEYLQIFPDGVWCTGHISGQRCKRNRRTNPATQQLQCQLHRPQIVETFKVKDITADKAINILHAPAVGQGIACRQEWLGETATIEEDVESIFRGTCNLGHRERVQAMAEISACQGISMAASGYANMLSLGRPKLAGDLWAYQWGDTELILTEQGESDENLFELDARDIVLFKRHPEATSARNLLACRVISLFGVNNRVGVELACGGNRLVAQIVPESVREMGISEGVEVVAVIKASSFRKLL